VRLLKKFLEGVGSSLTVDEERLLRINNRRFTVGENLDDFIFRWDNLVYAGKLLGKDRRLFHPSPTLLQEIASEEGSLNRVHVDRETGWLFVCGRDVFEESILRKDGGFEEGDLSLVMLEGDCLGYGRIEMFQGKKILKNVFDIGDFLRRERWRT
jgi:ribosome biogenesis protein Nip4